MLSEAISSPMRTIQLFELSYFCDMIRTALSVSKIMRLKLFKYLFYFFLFLTICSFFGLLVLIFFFDPKFNKFENYERLYNWDLKQYAVGDFDNDGKKDVISYTGCAFLSSVSIQNIPQNQQCTEKGTTTVIYYPDKSIKIGQKYIPIQTINLDIESFRGTKRPVSHSYLFKKQNENWKIFVNSEGLAIFEIRKDGLLQEVSNVPIEFKLDEILYFLSPLGLYILIPLNLFSFADDFRFYNHIIPSFLIILPMITTIIYFLWKKK